jgi:Tol biopolymer transport system component
MLVQEDVTQVAGTRRLVQALILLGIASAAGCGGGSDGGGPTDPPPPPPPPTVGSIQVTVASSGEDVDGNGYSIQLDGAPKAAIGANGSVALHDLAAGTHSVAIEGLAENCAVTSDNPVSVSVTAGDTASTSFAVSCVAAVGSLEVSASTTGEALDDDGYVVTVIGGPSDAVDANGSMTLTDVAIGARNVALSDVSANCAVTGTNPRGVAVAFGQTAQVAFDVECVAPPPGTIAFLSERGNNPQREVFLMDGAGGSARQITDMPGAGEKNSALISPDGSKVLFDTWEGRDLWVVNSDGTGLLNLTDSPYEEDGINAAWSPDGSKIAFTRNGDDQDCANGGPDACGLWTINADGTGLTRLTADNGDGFQGGWIDWSPDGLRLVFSGWIPGDYNPGDPFFDLFVIDSDGSGLQQLTSDSDHYSGATWSPSGDLIAFQSCCTGSFVHLFVMAPDGTGVTQLTDDGLGWDAYGAEWSPDGSRIAFGCMGLCVINPDGSGLETVTEVWPWRPLAWAPDGSVIGFTSDPSGRRDVYTIRPDGTGLRNLTDLSTGDYFGSWAP